VDARPRELRLDCGRGRRFVCVPTVGAMGTPCEGLSMQLAMKESSFGATLTIEW